MRHFALPEQRRPYASGAGHEFANDAQLGLCDTHIEIFVYKVRSRLDSQGKTDLNKRDESFDSNQDRSLPLVKVDSGLYFDRDTTFAGTPFRQTLEPRAMYLYVPYKDQDSLPVFDTSEPSFSYDSLWRENRFTGKDRIGDANQLSLGVTSRFIEENGFERASISAGQIYYFRDRRVQLPGLTEKDLKRLNPDPSGLTMTAGALPTPLPASTVSTATGASTPTSIGTPTPVVLSPVAPSSTTSPKSIRARWSTLAIAIVQMLGALIPPAAHSDMATKTTSSSSTISRSSGRWCRSGPCSPAGSTTTTRTAPEAFGGFEYDSCCWKLRLINRYWLDVDDDAFLVQSEKADRGIFLQIVLKGLGGIVGNKTEMFLDKGIQGYRQREDQAM